MRKLMFAAAGFLVLTAAAAALVSRPNVAVLFADLRLVVLNFEDGSLMTKMVHHSHVDRFIAASTRLHHDPGVNPHNGQSTLRLNHIKVGRPDANTFWWSTPDLQRNGDPNGAAVYDFHTFTTVWQAPR